MDAIFMQIFQNSFFFSEFRVVNRLWLLAFGLWQPHKKGYVFYLS